jgi:molybdopterin biosynthesis enzyme
MLSMEAALRLVMQKARPIGRELVSVSEALSRVSAEDVVAAEPFPTFPCSIMDGYAVRAPQAAGWVEVSGRAMAGGQEMVLDVGCGAMYVATGARLPIGADAVIKVEDTRLQPGVAGVELLVGVDRPGLHVREVGSDVIAGQVLLPAGRVVGPVELGLLATYGEAAIICTRRPIVGVLSTGDELVEAEEVPVGSQIRDSNRPALLSLLATMSPKVECRDLGIVRDSDLGLRALLMQAARECDVVVTTGGVSMGAADHVKPRWLTCTSAAST